MWVGRGFDPDTDVFMTRANTQDLPIGFTPGQWPSTWQKSYDAGTGLLTVTMDMSFPEFAAGVAKTREEHCRPASFCASNGSTSKCDCALQTGDHLYSACTEKNADGDDAICSWTIKDVDCPHDDATGKAGCYGFGFELGSGFTTDPGDVRPSPDCFPSDTAWNVPFLPASQELAGAACLMPAPPPGTFCGM